MLDAPSLTALSIPVGSRVLALHAVSAGPLDAGLVARNCTVETISDAAGLASFDGAAFDAVVIADGFEQLDDPVAVLRDAAALLSDGGRVITVADNAANATARVRSFLGQDDTATPPPRRYDLAALEQVIAKAGLVVIDRVRVFDDGAPAATASADASDLTSLASGPEARIRSFVLVTAPAEQVAGSDTPTLTEVLQAENEDLQRELDARADALVERIELVERLHTESRHLQLDLAVKDDYIAILRSEILDRRAAYDALRYEHDDLLRSRHYRAAMKLHKLLTRVPLVHRLVTGLTKLAAPIARRGRDTPSS